MKKYVIGLFFLILFFGVLCGSSVEANEQVINSQLTITFDKEDHARPVPPIIEEPTLPEILKPQPTPKGRLPSTGDLISSLIYTIVGFSFLLVVLGIYFLKKIMLKMKWE